MKLSFTKTQTGLIPANEDSIAWILKIKAGSLIQGTFTKKQNSKFHAKMFALLKVGFDNWQPGVVQVRISGEPVTPEKNFQQFREDLTILAGYYNIIERIDGSTRPKAKSLSFDKMSPEEREDIYNKFIDVLLANIYSNSDRAEIDNAVNAYLSFA